MNAITSVVQKWMKDVASAWNRFWFTPSEPHTLAVIRILAGAMLFYTHLVWSFDLMSFIGPDSWINDEAARQIQQDWYTWSFLWHIDSPALLWTLHIAALLVFAMLTLGLFSRVTTVLAWLITVAYCHRLHGALFGLDQVNAMLAMYLMIGPCGAVYSLDRIIARRLNEHSHKGMAARLSWLKFLGIPIDTPKESSPSISANVTIRLIQLHMCVIYLFGGIAKMRGNMWWDGSAVWYAVANLEYQSIDMTWLVHFPALIALLTHVTVFWETFYCALVWPRLTRPIVLAIAIGVHGGIALFLGMITFGLAMLIGNLAFVSPRLVQMIVEYPLNFVRKTAEATEASRGRQAKVKSNG